MDKGLTIGVLIRSIYQIHEHMAAQAGKAVNISLTLRNWAIGYYIQEYEQNGSDRAVYGKNLLNRLSKELKRSGAVEYHPRELRRCRLFYSTYPQIWGTLSPELMRMLPKRKRGIQTPSSTSPASGTFPVSLSTLP